MRSQIVTVPFALYVSAMASSEKMSSGNADTTFVSNCDHNNNYVVCIQTARVLCSVPMYKRATQYYGINATMDMKKAS